MEPSAQDVASVQAAMGSQPAPQQQPEPVSQQPTPSQQPAEQSPPAQQEQSSDPFAQFANQQPTPQPTPQPAEPTPAQQPTEPQQPAQQQPTPQPAPQPQEKTYQQYLEEAMKDVPQIPTAPDASQVNPDDAASVKGFFDDLMATAEKRFEANFTQKQAVQNLENRLWNEAFEQYGTLKDNSNLRDMVQAIRMAEFQKGNAMTPKQAAQRLLSSFQQQYQQGVTDSQVQTRIEQVQPTGGGSTQVATNYDAQSMLESVQTGGEDALVAALSQKYGI